MALAVAALAAAYILWKIAETPDQALQFGFNGLAVGAVYALLAMGFTLVYSTVWFFDLYYGAAAALGAYGVFYLRSQDSLGGLYAVNNLAVNVLLAAVVAGVVAWALHEGAFSGLRRRVNREALLAAEAAMSAGAAVYTGFILTYPAQLNVTLSPAVGILTALAAGFALQQGLRRVLPGAGGARLLALAVLPGAALGAYCALLVAETDGSKLYLSWAVSCLLSGAVGLSLYRGLYVSIRQRARSPLIMLVASLGVLLAVTAAIAIVFQSAPRPLPEAFGTESWTVGGGSIKGFNVFTIGVTLAGFVGLLFLLNRTSFGRAIRAIGDDEEVSKVVGINTTFVIAVVFFIGAAFAAMAGLLSGHDTAIQPRMGLLLLLKGWIASVVGGIGNLYGAVLGGFALGMIEQFGIWDLAGEWRDVISFMVLIVFLSFWPRGLLPRR